MGRCDLRRDLWPVREASQGQPPTLDEAMRECLRCSAGDVSRREGIVKSGGSQLLGCTRSNDWYACLNNSTYVT